VFGQAFTMMSKFLTPYETQKVKRTAGTLQDNKAVELCIADLKNMLRCSPLAISNQYITIKHLKTT
jgi:hypothetical protein